MERSKRIIVTAAWREYVCNCIKHIDGPYFICGAGKHTQMLLTLLKEKEIKLPEAVFDKEPVFKRIEGIPCIKPNEFDMKTFKNPVVILSSDSSWTREKMKGQLKDITVYDIYKGLPDGPFLKEYPFV